MSIVVWVFLMPRVADALLGVGCAVGAELRELLATDVGVGADVIFFVTGRQAQAAVLDALTVLDAAPVDARPHLRCLGRTRQVGVVSRGRPLRETLLRGIDRHCRLAGLLYCLVA